MPGLVPGIHAKPRGIKPKIMRSGAAWMAGTNPRIKSGDGCDVAVNLDRLSLEP